MILQLDPQLPVTVKIAPDTWEKGYAFCIIDYSQEHDLLFTISLNKSGEIVTVPNSEVRIQQNWSLNRRVTTDKVI